MATTAEYLNKLVEQKNTLADNLATKGVSATHDETLETLVPKVLDISGGAGGNGIYPIGEDGFPYGDVIVPEGVTSISSGLESNERKSCFYGNSNVNTVKLPSTIQTLGYNSFFSCGNLKEIIMPDSVSTIGKGAFKSCKNLSSISFPTGNIELSEECFSYCSSLTNLTIPNNITSLGTKSTFSNCTGLTKVIFKDGSTITTIPSSCFYQCSNLKEINIPTSVTLIDYTAFYQCKSLAKIEIPSGVTTLSGGAFRECTGLVQISLPNTITSLNVALNSSANTFYRCTSLATVNLEQGFNCSINLYATTVLSNAAEMLTKLKDLTGETAKTITFAKSVYDGLTADEISVATNKNWTVASYG